MPLCAQDEWFFWELLHPSRSTGQIQDFGKDIYTDHHLGTKRFNRHQSASLTFNSSHAQADQIRTPINASTPTGVSPKELIIEFGEDLKARLLCRRYDKHSHAPVRPEFVFTEATASYVGQPHTTHEVGGRNGCNVPRKPGMQNTKLSAALILRLDMAQTRKHAT